LETGAHAALVFNSGMAAIMTALFTFARPGQTIIYTVPIYGGTQHLIEDFLSTLGILGIPVEAGNTRGMDEAIRSAKELAIILVETPANPTIVMTDIQHAADAAAWVKPKPVVMVDNTLMGPAFQHPLVHGADLSLYSATKYLSGLSDLIAGAAIASDPELIRKMQSKRNLFGNILQPDECWMLEGRLPTVMLRMNRSSKNAERIATRLAKHPKIARVLYPALFSDPEQLQIVRNQCDFPGGMLSIDLRGGKPAAFEFLRNLRIAHNAVSLGGVETLVCHPKTTTHSGFTEEEFAAAGVTDGLVRISVGIEDWRDLVADFEQALDLV
jgi:cystathionine beta-lyase/cystathionine gamma-synthase